MQVICLYCQKEFKTYPQRVKIGAGKYCSRKCADLSKRGKPTFFTFNCPGNTGRTRFKKGMTPWNKGIKTGIKPWLGKKRTLETIAKIKKNRTGKMTGKDHWGWRGDKVTYFTLHQWINKHKGKASICSFNPDHLVTRYHWANISKSYKKDLDDFVSLCPTCHKQYDLITKGRVYLRG